jgi:hypothetical protein
LFPQRIEEELEDVVVEELEDVVVEELEELVLRQFTHVRSAEEL